MPYLNGIHNRKNMMVMKVRGSLNLRIRCTAIFLSCHPPQIGIASEKLQLLLNFAIVALSRGPGMISLLTPSCSIVQKSRNTLSPIACVVGFLSVCSISFCTATGYAAFDPTLSEPLIKFGTLMPEDADGPFRYWNTYKKYFLVIAINQKDVPKTELPFAQVVVAEQGKDVALSLKVMAAASLPVAVEERVVYKKTAGNELTVAGDRYVVFAVKTARLLSGTTDDAVVVDRTQFNL
jgi:hypothetical protein